MNLTLRIACAAIVGAFATGAFAQRMPTVDYTVSGSTGNWTLNFNVTNHLLNGEGNIYFFGVLLDTGANLTGSPNGWGQWNGGAQWNNQGYGGSNTNYNNNWYTNYQGPDYIVAGASLSGFTAISTDAVAPGTVKFFAFAAGGSYNGNDHFYTNQYPGFEGTANAVPEPATLAVLAVGSLALLRRRKRS